MAKRKRQQSKVSLRNHSTISHSHVAQSGGSISTNLHAEDIETFPTSIRCLLNNIKVTQNRARERSHLTKGQRVSFWYLVISALAGLCIHLTDFFLNKTELSTLLRSCMLPVSVLCMSISRLINGPKDSVAYNIWEWKRGRFFLFSYLLFACACIALVTDPKFTKGKEYLSTVKSLVVFMGVLAILKSAIDLFLLMRPVYIVNRIITGIGTVSNRTVLFTLFVLLPVVILFPGQPIGIDGISITMSAMFIMSVEYADTYVKYRLMDPVQNHVMSIIHPARLFQSLAEVALRDESTSKKKAEFDQAKVIIHQLMQENKLGVVLELNTLLAEQLGKKEKRSWVWAIAFLVLICPLEFGLKAITEGILQDAYKPAVQRYLCDQLNIRAFCIKT